MRISFHFSSPGTHWRWHMLGVLGLLWVGFSGLAHGQATTTTLTVQLRDTADQPIAGAAVRVLEASTLEPLANSYTDGNGMATFVDVPTTTIRIVVEGVLPNGTPLVLLGQDAEGIWVTLPPSRWLMDLRVDMDGAVFPDMGLSGAGAADGDDHAAIANGTFAQATPAASSRAVIMPPSMPTAAAVVTSSEDEDPSAETYEFVVGLMFMLVFGLAIAAIIVFGRRL